MFIFQAIEERCSLTVTFQAATNGNSIAQLQRCFRLVSKWKESRLLSFLKHQWKFAPRSLENIQQLDYEPEFSTSR